MCWLHYLTSRHAPDARDSLSLPLSLPLALSPHISLSISLSISPSLHLSIHWYVSSNLVCNFFKSGALTLYYSTGVQIVSCTLSDDSVLSESTGLFNAVLCVRQWNLFWQKNQPIRLCLSNQVRPGFPFPLGDFNRLFEGLIGELFKIWHWHFFKMISVWSLKCKFVSLLCRLKQADCSVHFTIKK